MRNFGQHSNSVSPVVSLQESPRFKPRVGSEVFQSGVWMFYLCLRGLFLHTQDSSYSPKCACLGYLQDWAALKKVISDPTGIYLFK